MPRSTPEQITARPVVDPSRGSGVGLTVQASQPRSRGAMWGVASALQGLQGDVNQQLRADASDRKEANARAAREQKIQDEKDGKAKADEAAVTGIAPDLQGASDDLRKSYQQVDGANAVNSFENDIAPDLARLEPGEDIDKWLQTKVNDWLEDKNLPEESRKTFMVGAQESFKNLKANYLKQSINESFKRQEEGFGSLLNGNLQNGSISTPEQVAEWRKAAALHGLRDDEIDKAAADAITAALSSGKVDITKTLALARHPGADGVILADHPEYSEKFQNAAQAGETEQKKQRQKAQFDSEVAMLDSVNSQADKGLLGRAQVTALAKQYDKSPEWAASMLDKARSAREKAAKEADKEAKRQAAMSAFQSGDRLHQEAVGYEEVRKAGEELFQQVIKNGIEKNDLSDVPKFIKMAAANNGDFPAYGRVMQGFADTSNPARFEYGYKLFKTTQNTAPGWAESNMDAKTLAKFHEFERRTEVYHDNVQQALEAINAVKEIDPEVLSKQKAAVAKQLPKSLPSDFDDSAWFSFSPHGATKIANVGYMQSEVSKYTEDALSQGQFWNDPEGAIKFGIDKFKADHVRVGDRYERSFGSVTGQEQAAKVGEAMTTLQEAKHAELVAKKIIDPEDAVGFAPTPNAPNKWQLWYLHAGTRRPITETVDVDGKRETRPIEVVASDVAAKHEAWKKQEAAREAETAQGWRKFGIVGDVGDAKQANEYLSQITYNQAGDLGTYNHVASPTPVADALNTPKGRDAARAFVNDPARTKQSFTDFLNSTK